MNHWASAPEKASEAQIRKICAVINEKQLDESIWRDEMFRLTGRESRNDLTKHEAMRFIDHLESLN